MFGFLKKLFGGDSTVNKEAGIQIEQVSTPVVDVKVETANQAPYKVETLVATAPEAKAPVKKKPQAAKPKAVKPAATPAVITAPKKSGRKPKAK